MLTRLTSFAVVLIASCAPMTLALSADSDESVIRDARRQMSEALAAREFAVIEQHITSNVSITGPVWRTVGREQVIQAYSRLMTRRPDLAWTYEAQEIRFNRDWPVASESGTWRETWSEPDGLTDLRGSYMALWRRMDGRWLLDAQVFIPLTCTGSSYCLPRR
jgi:ketosteroid isomerase-like protein